MARFFIDFEFIEGFHKPLFGKRRHFIDIISVGIVCEDGREYYAISNEFNEKDADSWVYANVIAHLPKRKVSLGPGGDSPRIISESLLWKNNKQIATEIVAFISNTLGNSEAITHRLKTYPPEFYGYYSDYDWVLFCSLFGRMIDLPVGFPMYCRDLKQMFDDKISPQEIMGIGYEAAVERLKKKVGYPIQKDEHNALADAKWNMELYRFLKTF